MDKIQQIINTMAEENERLKELQFTLSELYLLKLAITLLRLTIPNDSDSDIERLDNKLGLQIDYYNKGDEK